MTADAWDAYKHGEHVCLVSRNGRDHAARFGDIARAVAELPARTLILDGELCAFDVKLGLPPRRELRGAGNAAAANGVRLLVPTRTHSMSRQRKRRYTLAWPLYPRPPRRVSVYPARADLLWGLKTMKLRLGKLLPIQRTYDQTPRYFFPSFTAHSLPFCRDSLEER